MFLQGDIAQSKSVQERCALPLNKLENQRDFFLVIPSGAWFRMLIPRRKVMSKSSVR